MTDAYKRSGARWEVFDGLREGDVLATGVDLDAATGAGRRGSSLFGPAPAQF